MEMPAQEVLSRTLGRGDVTSSCCFLADQEAVERRELHSSPAVGATWPAQLASANMP